MTDIEFVVEGTPRAWRARTSAKWQNQIRISAAPALSSLGSTLDGPVSVCIIYFHYDPADAIDVDNMAKPVLDALIGIAFTDDRLVEELVSRRTMISSGFELRDPTAILKDALDRSRNFVLIRLKEPPDHSVIP